MVAAGAGYEGSGCGMGAEQQIGACQGSRFRHKRTQNDHTARHTHQHARAPPTAGPTTHLLQEGPAVS